jgi:hypothetical protein
MNEKRIKKAIAASYAKAREKIAEAREAGTLFAYRVAMEWVQEIRRLNSDRRRALKAGHPVERTKA